MEIYVKKALNLEGPDEYGRYRLTDHATLTYGRTLEAWRDAALEYSGVVYSDEEREVARAVVAHLESLPVALQHVEGEYLHLFTSLGKDVVWEVVDGSWTLVSTNGYGVPGKTAEKVSVKDWVRPESGHKIVSHGVLSPGKITETYGVGDIVPAGTELPFVWVGVAENLGVKNSTHCLTIGPQDCSGYDRRLVWKEGN